MVIKMLIPEKSESKTDREEYVFYMLRNGKSIPIHTTHKNATGWLEREFKTKL